MEPSNGVRKGKRPHAAIQATAASQSGPLTQSVQNVVAATASITTAEAPYRGHKKKYLALYPTSDSKVATPESPRAKPSAPTTISPNEISEDLMAEGVVEPTTSIKLHALAKQSPIIKPSAAPAPPQERVDTVTTTTTHMVVQVVTQKSSITHTTSSATDLPAAAKKAAAPPDPKLYAYFLSGGTDLTIYFQFSPFKDDPALQHPELVLGGMLKAALNTPSPDKKKLFLERFIYLTKHLIMTKQVDNTFLYCVFVKLMAFLAKSQKFPEEFCNSVNSIGEVFPNRFQDRFPLEFLRLDVSRQPDISLFLIQQLIEILPSHPISQEKVNPFLEQYLKLIAKGQSLSNIGLQIPFSRLIWRVFDLSKASIFPKEVRARIVPALNSPLRVCDYQYTVSQILTWRMRSLLHREGKGGYPAVMELFLDCFRANSFRILDTLGKDFPEAQHLLIKIGDIVNTEFKDQNDIDRLLLATMIELQLGFHFEESINWDRIFRALQRFARLNPAYAVLCLKFILANRNCLKQEMHNDLYRNFIIVLHILYEAKEAAPIHEIYQLLWCFFYLPLKGIEVTPENEGKVLNQHVTLFIPRGPNTLILSQELPMLIQLMKDTNHTFFVDLITWLLEDFSIDRVSQAEAAAIWRALIPLIECPQIEKLFRRIDRILHIYCLSSHPNSIALTEFLIPLIAKFPGIKFGAPLRVALHERLALIDGKEHLFTSANLILHINTKFDRQDLRRIQTQILNMIKEDKNERQWLWFLENLESLTNKSTQIANSTAPLWAHLVEQSFAFTTKHPETTILFYKQLFAYLSLYVLPRFQNVESNKEVVTLFERYYEKIKSLPPQDVNTRDFVIFLMKYPSILKTFMPRLNREQLLIIKWNMTNLRAANVISQQEFENFMFDLRNRTDLWSEQELLEFLPRSKAMQLNVLLNT